MPVTPRSVTNDRKRQEMSDHIRRLHDLGWTNAKLAVWMWVTSSTVAHWARAGSMGTNVQRDELRQLGSLQNERLRILDFANSLERDALAAENLLEEDLAKNANVVAEYRRRNIARIRLRVLRLRELFA